MGNRFKTAIIDDTTASHINATHQENLLDLFESAMKSVAVTLIREAHFDTTDFATAKRRGCEGFELSMKRLNADRTAWTGTFQRGEERLEVGVGASGITRLNHESTSEPVIQMPHSTS